MSLPYTPNLKKIVGKSPTTVEEFEKVFIAECKAFALDCAMAETGVQIVIPQGCEDDRDFIAKLGATVKRSRSRTKMHRTNQLQKYMRQHWQSYGLSRMTMKDLTAKINARFRLGDFGESLSIGAVTKIYQNCAGIVTERKPGPLPRK